MKKTKKTKTKTKTSTKRIAYKAAAVDLAKCVVFALTYLGVKSGSGCAFE